MVRAGVLLGDAQAVQLGLEAVAPAFAARQPGGEDHAVVGQRGGRNAMGGNGFPEGAEDDPSGDPAVGGDRQGLAGVVIQPGEDLGAGPVGEPIVGEVGLPALVGLVGLEANVGRTWAASSGRG